jgi:hypothetical protein
MKSATVCDHEVCESTILERPRYFPRQLISDTELTQEQNYFRDKLRRHNRLLHGWGVVCGALVCPYVKDAAKNELEPWKVVVHPGYILGPYGDEIVIGCQRVFDLRTTCLPGVSGDPCADTPVETVDPWCSKVFVKQDTPAELYVAVRYKECLTRPVRVQPLGCGCDESQCEYSRWRDGYEICVLPRCPDDQTQPAPDTKKATDRMAPMHGVAGAHAGSGQEHTLPPWPMEPKVIALAGCPTCPTDPWVVLAQVTVGPDGVVTRIDNCACRRLVYSLASVRGYCEPTTIAINAVTVTPDTPATALRPGTSATVVTAASGLADGATLSFGPGVSVIDTPTFVKERNQITARIQVDPSATPGPRTVVVTNPDCSTATFKADAMTIAEPERGRTSAPSSATGSESATPPRRGRAPRGGGKR